MIEWGHAHTTPSRSGSIGQTIENCRRVRHKRTRVSNRGVHGTVWYGI